jgi:tRNA A-37 threonylcarbamoyl transferase component Bud32
MKASRRMSEAALSLLLTDFLGKDTASVVCRVRRLKSTKNSTLFLVKSGPSSSPMIVKQLHTDDLKEQYQSLLSMSNSLTGLRYRVPKPITCFPEERLICMEYVEGAALDKLLLSSGVSDEEKGKSVEESGRWLARFHSVRTEGCYPVDLGKKQDDLETYLLQAGRHFERDCVLQQAVDWLGEKSADAGTIDVPQGAVHGDFKPENLLIQDGAVVGIDFLAEGTGSQIMDLAQFTNQLRFLGMRPKGFGKSRLIDRWVEFFVKGYEENRQQVPTLLLTWLRVQHLIRYWAMERTRKYACGLLQSLWVRNEIKRVLGFEERAQ